MPQKIPTMLDRRVRAEKSVRDSVRETKIPCWEKCILKWRPPMLTVVARVLTAALGTSSPDSRTAPLLTRYATATQWAGRGPLVLDASARRELQAAAPGIGFERWTRDDAA